MRRLKRPSLRRLMLPAAAAGALLAAGCSGEIGWPDGGADKATKSSFVKEGNDILCTKSDRIMRAVTGQVLSGHEPTAAQEGALVLPALRTAYRDLDELTVARSEEREVAHLMSGFRHALNVVSAHPERLAGDDDPFAAVDRDLAAYGLDGCN